ncbi:hypothetical protein RYX36_037002 [Vicia faba]
MVFVLFLAMMENDFGLAAARLFDWLIYLMKLKTLRSGSGTGTSSLFDMVSFHQSDSTGSKGFTSEPFLARGH